MRSLFAVVALIACGLASAATCSVTEFRDRPPVTYQAAIVPVLASSIVTYTTSSVQSNVFNVDTVLVRITCDALAYVLFGTNPTALLTSMRLGEGQTEYFTVIPANSPPYTSLRLAVIGP
jgi:hypothetical protein